MLVPLGKSEFKSKLNLTGIKGLADGGEIATAMWSNPMSLLVLSLETATFL
jgi:hypothetical protein